MASRYSHDIIWFYFSGLSNEIIRKSNYSYWRREPVYSTCCKYFNPLHYLTTLTYFRCTLAFFIWYILQHPKIPQPDNGNLRRCANAQANSPFYDISAIFLLWTAWTSCYQMWYRENVRFNQCTFVLAILEEPNTAIYSYRVAVKKKKVFRNASKCI